MCPRLAPAPAVPRASAGRTGCYWCYWLYARRDKHKRLVEEGAVPRKRSAVPREMAGVATPGPAFPVAK